MRPYVVLNPGAGSADPDAVAAALSRLPAAVVGACEAPGDAPRLAVEAARAGFDPVVAAGGDGTVSAVAHGLSSLTSPPRLAILPLGTGNDLARTLAIPLAIDEAVDALLAEIVRSIDLIDVESDDKTRTTAINVSAGGFSGEVDEAMTSERKRRWGPLAYVWTALQVLPDIESYRTRLWLDGGPLLEIDALNVIVANGRTVGGGRAVAPLANPEDGLLDVVAGPPRQCRRPGAHRRPPAGRRLPERRPGHPAPGGGGARRIGPAHALERRRRAGHARRRDLHRAPPGAAPARRSGILARSAARRLT
jgi:diacylglycerol kinase (ATP)